MTRKFEVVPAKISAILMMMNLYQDEWSYMWCLNLAVFRILLFTVWHIHYEPPWFHCRTDLQSCLICFGCLPMYSKSLSTFYHLDILISLLQSSMYTCWTQGGEREKGVYVNVANFGLLLVCIVLFLPIHIFFVFSLMNSCWKMWLICACYSGIELLMHGSVAHLLPLEKLERRNCNRKC